MIKNIISVLFLVFTTSCGFSKLEGNSIHTSTPPPLTKKLLTVTRMPTKVITHIPPTNTIEVKRSTPTPETLTSIPTDTIVPLPPTLTPYPTILPKQRLNYWIEKISLTDCKLPCLLGMDPGKAALLDAFELFHPMYGSQKRMERLESVPHQYSFWAWFEDEQIPEMSIRIIEEKEVIDQIHFDIDYLHSYSDIAHIKLDQAMERYSLQNVLVDLGQPKQVYVDLQPGRIEKDAPWSYSLLLVYDSTLVVYDFAEIGISSVGEKLRVCPSYPALQNIGIYVSSSVGSDLVTWFFSKVKMSAAMSDGFKKNAYLLTDVTDYTLESFADTFGQPESVNCFESPVDFWREEN
jgi:hypothetical protein